MSSSLQYERSLRLPACWSLALIITLTLGGCVSNTPSWQSDLPAANLTHWEASGKLGLVHQGQARTVNFQWKNRARKFDIRLFGTLGMGGARLSGNNRSVTLKTKDGTYESANVDSLVETTLNMSIPVEDLVFWIRGVPAPGAPISQKTLHPDGSLALLIQRGWTLRYPRYFQNRSPLLPGKIIAEREGLKLTIAIKSWQLD